MVWAFESSGQQRHRLGMPSDSLAEKTTEQLLSAQPGGAVTMRVVCAVQSIDADGPDRRLRPVVPFHGDAGEVGEAVGHRGSVQPKPPLAESVINLAQSVMFDAIVAVIAPKNATTGLLHPPASDPPIECHAELAGDDARR